MHTATDSTSGLLLSLSSELPRSSPLARKARSLASRLSHGASSSDDQTRAADLLARLLTATDPGLLYPEEGLLDPSFDD